MERTVHKLDGWVTRALQTRLDGFEYEAGKTIAKTA